MQINRLMNRNMIRWINGKAVFFSEELHNLVDPLARSADEVSDIALSKPNGYQDAAILLRFAVELRELKYLPGNQTIHI